MSVLSSTQGTPARVWSLLNLLRVCGGSLPRSDAALWLNPAFRVGTGPVSLAPTHYAQTQGAAVSLNLVELEGDTLRLRADCATFVDFADLVHERLIALPRDHADALLLDMYAWLVLALEHDPSLLMDGANIADRSNAQRLSADDADSDFKFNTTKYKPWRGWMEFLGLGYDLPEHGSQTFFAHAAERLSRVLQLSDLPRNQEIPAATLLTAIQTQMPYLDGGDLFRRLQAAMGVTITPGKLSGVLSRALLDLKHCGELELVRVGDAGNLVHLQVDDRHNAFQAVILKGRAP